MSDEQGDYSRERVIVETAERVFRGYVYRPVGEPPQRLSDYLNNYSRAFINLSDVSINDRGQIHRPGERRDFVAISVASITYITPMRENEP